MQYDYCQCSPVLNTFIMPSCQTQGILRTQNLHKDLVAIHQTWLLLRQVLHRLNQLFPRIILQLFCRFIQDLGKDWDKLRSKALDSLVVMLV